MQFYVYHAGQQDGPIDVQLVRSRLADGSYQGSDLAWYEGAADWMPLASIPALSHGTPPPVPAGASATQLMPATYQAHPQTSGLAVASMILGILSLLTVGLTSLPAVICGHLSLLRIRKAAGAATGEGVAIAGLVMGYIGLCFFALFFLGIIAGIALPVFNTVQERALVTRSITQAKTIGLALKVYARDHDGRYPARLDDIVPNYLSNKRLLICPLGSSGYNYFGAGITNDAPPTTVLLTSQATTRRHERIVVHLDTMADLERE